MTGFSIDDILDKKSTYVDDTGDEPPSFKYVPEYHYNRHLLSYTPPPPLLPPSRLNHRLRYHHRSYSPPYRCFRSQSPPRAAISPNSAHSDDLDIDKLSRRPRTSITVCQREFLEAEFQKERYPTLAYIDKLSRKVHLQQYVIKVWFQNRRAKFRKEGHRRKPTKDEKAEHRTKEHSRESVDYFAEQPLNNFKKDINKVMDFRQNTHHVPSSYATPIDKYSSIRYSDHTDTGRYCYGTKDHHCQCLMCRIHQ